MGCCKYEKSYPPPPVVSKYPCKVKIDKPCLQIGLEELVDSHIRRQEAERERQEELERERERNKQEKKKPCEDVKPPSTKKFREFLDTKICTLCFMRKWNVEDAPEGNETEGGFNEYFKGLGRKRNKYDWRKKCPRELDAYEKNLWIPICKPREKPPECKEPIDKNLCVFCLEDLYTGGFLHELFEKTLLIKKQSELSGDEIAERIGIRTRIIVHKKCYDSYTEAFTRDKQKEPDIDLDNKIEEDDDDDNCGQGEEEEEEEEVEVEKEEEGEGEEEENTPKKKPKDPDEWKCHYSQHFCLKKAEFPLAGSGKLTSEFQQC